MPFGRAAFLDRMAMLMTAPVEAAPEVATLPPVVSLRDDLLARHGDALLLLQARKTPDGQEVLLVVLEGDVAVVSAERERLADVAEAEAPRIELLDRATYEAIERLTGAGLLHAIAEGQTELVRSSRLAEAAEAVQRQRLAQSTEWLAAAERKLRMAMLLAQGGFAEEAMPALSECVKLAQNAQATMHGEPVDGDIPSTLAPRGGGAVEESAQSSVEVMLAEVRRSLAAAQVAA